MAAFVQITYGPNQEALARVVAIGLDQAIEGIDQQFYKWARDLWSKLP